MASDWLAHGSSTVGADVVYMLLEGKVFCGPNKAMKKRSKHRPLDVWGTYRAEIPPELFWDYTLL